MRLSASLAVHHLIMHAWVIFYTILFNYARMSDLLLCSYGTKFTSTNLKRSVMNIPVHVTVCLGLEAVNTIPYMLG